MAKEKKSIIIVKKIKKGGGGHHGGSWKVAYADFVTAMMAFFMVMWILGLDESTRQGIEQYFSSPVGIHKDGYSTGVSPLAKGSMPTPVGVEAIRMVTRSMEEEEFERLGERIEVQLQGPDGLGSIAAQVEVVMTEDGLRIELVEGGDGEIFFPLGSARLKPAAVRALQVIGAELKANDASIVVEGHTDSAPWGSVGYSNWELSADRANAARRTLEAAGLPPRRMQEIRGHADRHLRLPDAPLDKSNRRISVLLPFSSTPEETVTNAAM